MISEKTIIVSKSEFLKKATIYYDPFVRSKACILYFHGGGLLYGMRTDLPELHKQLLTKAGYPVIAFDYPLAPAADLDFILKDVCASVNHYISFPDTYMDGRLPFFLWGRSSGAYLCLLAASGGSLKKPPAGILSFYGYGFLCDGWFLTPSPYYAALPAVSSSIVNSVSHDILTEAPLSAHYSLYVYARQTGKWLDFIYRGRLKYFYLDYTLRTCGALPCALFCTHSTGDTDVPYAEFLELCAKYRAQRFVASSAEHDFDRNETALSTRKLLEAVIRFADQQLL